MASGSLIFSMLFLLAFGAYLFMGIFVMQLDVKGNLNRWFFTVCMALSFWSLGFAMANSAPNLETALFWRRFSALGWTIVFTVLFRLFLLLIRDDFGQKKWYYRVLFHVPAAICLYVFSISDTLAPAQYNLVLRDTGWVNVALNSGWDWFFYVYYVTYFLGSIGALVVWRKRSPDPSVHIQSRLIVRSLLIAFVLGTAFDVILSAFLSTPLPQIAPLLTLIPMGTTYYVIRRYRFLMSEAAKNVDLILDGGTRGRLYYYLGLAFLAVGIVNFLPIFLPGLCPADVPASYRAQVSVILFGLGLLILAVKDLKREDLRDVIILIITLVSIPATTFRYVDYAGVTLWALPMLLLIVALVFDNKLPLVLVTVTAVGTQLILWNVTERAAVLHNHSDFVVRIGLLLVAYWLGSIVNKIYVDRLRDNIEKATMQEMISDTSFAFMAIDQDNLHEKIDHLLQRAARTFEVDCAVLCKIHDGNAISVANQWCRDGSSHRLQAELHPAVVDALKGSGFFHTKNAAELFTAATVSIQNEDIQRVQSFVSIPIEEDGDITGFLGFASLEKTKEWSSASLEALRVLGNLVSDAMIRVRAEQEIQFLAYYDELTGLPNRTLFSDRLNQALHVARRSEVFVGVMFVNLDSFKMVNDTMGHEHGDQILLEVAQAMEQRLRKMDTVARFGGDEFMIMVNNIARSDDIHAVAEKVMDVFDEPFVVEGQEFFMTASAGVALFPVDGDDAETLIKNADLAMRRAKVDGKNQYVLCTADMKEEVKRNMKIANSLFRAQARGELFLQYQPQVRIDTGELIGLEALLRWNHPELGMIPPSVFIPMAEKNGLINSIGEWVLHTAAKQNKMWHDSGFPRVPVSVNLSVVQLLDPRIVEKVRNVLDKTGLSPEYLGLEITENVAIKEVTHIIDTFNRLRGLGLFITIDDFGTEYSSLSRLKALPIDGIKIDLHFIQSLEKSKKDQAITEVIINLAKSLGVGVLAEGVETAAQAEFLNLRQCDAAQGYYYFKPMPAEDIEAMMRARMQELS